MAVNIKICMGIYDRENKHTVSKNKWSQVYFIENSSEYLSS